MSKKIQTKKTLPRVLLSNLKYGDVRFRVVLANNEPRTDADNRWRAKIGVEFFTRTSLMGEDQWDFYTEIPVIGMAVRDEGMVFTPDDPDDSLLREDNPHDEAFVRSLLLKVASEAWQNGA